MCFYWKIYYIVGCSYFLTLSKNNIFINIYSYVFSCMSMQIEEQNQLTSILLHSFSWLEIISSHMENVLNENKFMETLSFIILLLKFSFYKEFLVNISFSSTLIFQILFFRERYIGKSACYQMKYKVISFLWITSIKSCNFHINQNKLTKNTRHVIYS